MGNKGIYSMCEENMKSHNFLVKQGNLVGHSRLVQVANPSRELPS